MTPTVSSAPSSAPAPSSASPLDAPAPARAVRRFSFDPTSSPVLAAALAWESAAPRD